MDKLVVMRQSTLEKLIQERAEEMTKEVNRSYEMELLMKQADIASLQSQINPHFLYNTLECIRGQALKEGSDDIAKITQALSRFFRYSISKQKNIVTLADELANVENYVTIQKYRFRDRFSLRIDIPDEEDILDSAIPKLALQPILENAIIHGFADRVTGGLITITGYITNDQLSITVSDNGCGMDHTALERLNEKLRNKDVSTGGKNGTGIGVQNVDRRLKLLFGDTYGLHISSIPGIGTDVELFLPHTPYKRV